MNLVGYARVSSEGQRDNTSLGTQREAIMMFCERFNHTLVAFYEDIESGSTIEKRESFQWALHTVAKAADGLIVYRMDRLTRSVMDAERLRQTFEKQGKTILSVCDPIDMKTDDGEFIFTIGSAIAQLERKRIAARSSEGRRKKRDTGGYIGGSPPYGYICYKRTLMECPQEQEVIKMVRELHFCKGVSVQQIINHLDRIGIPSKHGKGWTGTTIRRLLDGDPPVIDKLRAAGLLLSVESWESIYGTSRDKSAVDSTRNEEAS